MGLEKCGDAAEVEAGRGAAGRLRSEKPDITAEEFLPFLPASFVILWRESPYSSPNLRVLRHCQASAQIKEEGWWWGVVGGDLEGRESLGRGLTGSHVFTLPLIGGKKREERFNDEGGGECGPSGCCVCSRYKIKFNSPHCHVCNKHKVILRRVVSSSVWCVSHVQHASIWPLHSFFHFRVFFFLLP